MKKKTEIHSIIQNLEGKQKKIIKIFSQIKFTYKILMYINTSYSVYSCRHLKLDIVILLGVRIQLE